MYQIHAIKAFSDNYIWAIYNQHYCAVVDPGDAKPVLEFLEKHDLTLTDILLTHHHPDHIGGVNTLLQNYPNITVYGPNTERFPMVNQPCRGSQSITLDKLETQFSVLDVPGHTIDHIAFVDQRSAFVGDTLFSCGCGRLFEGSAEQMYDSLQKIAKLPATTLVYCAHEYTEANIEFALTVNPNNQALIDYAQTVKALRSQNQASIPVPLATELAVNPFLRADDSDIHASLSGHFSVTTPLTDTQAFTMLRQWKDNF